MFLGRKASGAGASGDGAGEALSPASAAAFIGASPLAQGGAPSRSEEPRTPRRGGMQANIDVAAPSEALMNTLNALNANMWIQSACMAVVTTVLLAAALHWLQPVMVPLVLAILLSYALSPVIGFCRTRMYMPHLAAVVVSLLIALLVLTVVANILYQSVRDLSSNTDAYVKRVNAIAAAADSLTIKLPGQEGWERDQLPSLLDIIKVRAAGRPARRMRCLADPPRECHAR